MPNLIFILTALVLSFSLTLAIMPWGIKLFEKLELGKKIRTEWLVGKATEFAKIHSVKAGTPTMGGIFIIISIMIIVFWSILMKMADTWILEHIWWNLHMNYTLWNRQETYIAIFTLMSVGIIWMIDDYLNIREIGRTKGLSARVKMTLLIIFWFIWAYWFYAKLGYSSIQVPFFGQIDLGMGYILIFILVFISAANSVNITDGLDGLAGWLLLFQYAAYGFIAYSKWLFILSAFCLIIAWALMAFLWFNIHPAKIFMGDVWSLSLGATLAVIALMTDTLLAFIVMSMLFIAETLSVVIQTASKKLRNGKKVFKISPFHHHLEAIWWQEETIVMRFWLIWMVLAVAGTIIAIVGK
jgi:phospho-N-acetylmuramoyl-pentapeptide-transferase